MPATAPTVRQYCHAQVLSLIKRRTLAGLRKSVEPVEQVAYARFLPEWQGVASSQRGTDAVLGALEQLSGYALPAKCRGDRRSAVESRTTPLPCWMSSPPAVRCTGSATARLAMPTAGCAGTSPTRSRIWHTSSLRITAVKSCLPRWPAAELLLRIAAPAGVGHLRSSGVRGALWDLVWAGLVVGDTFAPVRALAGRGTHRRPNRPTARASRPRLASRGLGRPTRMPRLASPTTSGRWALVSRGQPSAADRLAADVFAQLDRYGVVTRGSVLTENSEGGFGAAYRALAHWRSQASADAATSSKGLGPPSSPDRCG